MQEAESLKAHLQRRLGPTLFAKLAEKDIDALHQAGYDGDTLRFASRESLLQLKLSLPVVDMLLAKCGASSDQQEPKYIQVQHCIVDKLSEHATVSAFIIKDQQQLEEVDLLNRLNSSGLVKMANEEEETAAVSALPVNVIDFDDLEGGQLYLAQEASSILSSARRQPGSMVGAQKNEMTQAVERDAQAKDPSCVVRPELRKLTDSGGRDEMEVDGVIVCNDKAFALSHKSTYSGGSMITEIANKASTIQRKSALPEYAGTPYECFKGKEVVPVFMAENVVPEKSDIVRNACQVQRVRLYRRTGNTIGPWASMKRPERMAVASRGTMRRVLPRAPMLSILRVSGC